MNLSYRMAACAVFSLMFASPHIASAQSQTSPSVPVGWLSASPGIVRVGAKPTLKWGITYPATVVDYVTVTTPSTLVPKQDLDVEIRVLGAGVTVSNSNGSNMTFVPTEALFSYDGGNYNRIFYGTNPQVDPSRVVHTLNVKSGRNLRFGGRFFYNGSWGRLYTSTSGTMNVRTLVNGQTPPTTYSLINAPTLENFIKPYLDASGKVMIGPMDVIVFMELTHTDSQASELGYDLQDMVLLVTFKPRN